MRSNNKEIFAHFKDNKNYITYLYNKAIKTLYKIENNNQITSYQEIDVPSDGNCLFYSVAYAFLSKRDNKCSKEGLEAFQKILRNLVAKELNNNKDKYQDDINAILASDQNDQMNAKSVEDYISKISQDGVWGGDLELQILSKILKSNINVFKKQSGNWITFEGTNDKNNCIYIIHDDVTEHYNFLKPAAIENNSIKPKLSF